MVNIAKAQEVQGLLEKFILGGNNFYHIFMRDIFVHFLYDITMFL